MKLGSLGVINVLPKFNISLNDISTVEFSIPAYIFNEDDNDYSPTPFYNDVVGKRLLLIEPFGYFRITKLKVENDGIKEIKTITALSLEDELNDAKISAWEGTFPLYDLTNPNNTETVLGMVKALKPSWNIGYVSSKIWDYWRTFSITEKTLYAFLKEDIQKAFECVFVFDTYNRTINAYTLEDLTTGSILSMSHDNLIKNSIFEQLDEQIITRLEVYGAGDIDIREINPRGDNYLYNFDYFMNENWLPEETGTNGLIAAWNAYKALWEAKKGTYDDLMILWRIYTSNLLNALTKYTILQDEWNGLKTRQKDYVGYSTELYDKLQKQIVEIEPQINAQNQIVSQRQLEFDNIQLLIDEINDELQLNKHFTEEQLHILDTITFGDKLTCEHFVDNNVNFAGEPITANLIDNGTLMVNNGTIRRVINSVTGIETYQFGDSNVTFEYSGQILNYSTNVIEKKSCLVTADVKDGTVAMMTNGTYICTLNVNTGSVKIGNDTYPITNGVVTIASQSNTPNFTQDSRLQINGGEGSIYATEANTSLGRQKVIRELYDYANDIFDKISVPSFQFEVDSINPFFLQAFQPVLQNFKLGNTVSVSIKDDTWLKPMLLDVEIDYNDETKINLRFSNKLRFGSNEFDFTELFEEAITSGHDSTANKFDYMAFTGSNANNVIEKYIKSALDVSKQMLMNSVSQEMIMGGFGSIYRKANEYGSYEPEQAWWTNNQLAFTKDSWDSVSMAVGKIQLNGNSFYGVVADALVGRKVLGNELEFQATTNSGTDVAGFKFSGMGAEFNNARILSTSSSGFQVCIDAKNALLAMGSGIYSIDNKGNYIPRFNPPDNISSEKEWWTNPLLSGIQFFADGDGDIYLRGSVYAKNGYFHGTVYATDGEFTGTVYAHKGEFKGNVYANDLFLNGKSILNNLKDKITGQHLDLEGLYVRNGGQNSMTVKDGVIQFGTGTNSITIQNGKVYINPGVSLNWGSIDDVPNLALKSDIPNYIKSTYIDSTTVKSPTIEGGKIFGGIFGYDDNRFLTMNVSNGYFTLYDKTEFGTQPALSLITSANPGEKAVKFQTAGQDWLGYNYSQRKTYPIGVWNFGSAIVEGLTATFG